MKVRIEDDEVLKSIQPLQVVTYLRATGWQEENKNEGESSTWIKSNSSSEELILNLPLKPDVRLFNYRIADVLKTISEAENRSELDIFNDIRYSWSDVIRFYINNSDVINGSLPLEDNIHILTSIRDMLLWVACSTIDSRAYFHEKFPQAVDYVSRLRIGQTEQGLSYVFTIISPIISVKNQLKNVSPDLSSIPFERQVVQKLALALETLRIEAEKESYQENTEFIIEDNVSAISANFCHSVLQMNDFNHSNGLKVRISWSSLLPISSPISSEYNLSANIMPVISKLKAQLTAYS